MTVADFLIERLENAGIKHLFGVPGDYIIDFFPKIVASKKITLVSCADEAGAGFAADGYARTHGLGCLVVTYNVGALKVCNPIACAYAERSPVILISGSPGVSERDVLMHHTVRNFDCQKKIFKELTCAQAILDNPQTAGYEIDRCFEALKHYKQPVYIELPRDVAGQCINYDVYSQGTPKAYISDEHNLADSIQEVSDWINSSHNPLILAGVDVARYGFSKDLMKFAEKVGIPVACTLLSKSVMNEHHPLFAGVYAGAISKSSVKYMVDNSDCLIVLGEVITEATVGYTPSKTFWKRDMITATVEQLKVKNHNYPDVAFQDFCKALFRLELDKHSMHLPEKILAPVFEPVAGKKLTTLRFFEKIDSILNENTIVVADTGDSLLGASDLTSVYTDSFFGPAFYLTMGYALPASVGIQLAKHKHRPIVIVGDGATQMSMAEIGTMFKYNLNPIIFLLNNGGYGTERVFHEGIFNDIVNWNYEQIPQIIGGGKGFKVITEEELEKAVDIALASNVFCILNCLVERTDISPALRRLGETLAKKVKL
jgi:indolepyruvate decarboxylase